MCLRENKWNRYLAGGRYVQNSEGKIVQWDKKKTENRTVVVKAADTLLEITWKKKHNFLYARVDNLLYIIHMAVQIKQTAVVMSEEVQRSCKIS